MSVISPNVVLADNTPRPSMRLKGFAIKEREFSGAIVDETALHSVLPQEVILPGRMHQQARFRGKWERAKAKRNAQ